MQQLNVQSPQANAKAPRPDQSKCKLKFDYSPSPDNVDLNLLILLHGLGDTKTPFAKLASKLKLPQTATLAIQAPEPIPYMEECYQWYPSFDVMTGHLLPPTNPQRMKGLTRTRQLITELLRHLIDDCHFQPPNIFLFGFSQGGTVALDIALLGSIRNLGGVVSISGYLLEEQASLDKQGNGYDGYILVTQGEKDPTVGDKKEAEKKFQIIKRFCASTAQTSQVFITNKGHSMPNGEGEWRVIHTFFSDYMPRRNLALENMSDVYLVNPS
ncbi:hypothetical protein DFQ28_010355 [Apophysomyces sp. BC1034]|nr:hypothetical protein DFQ30_009998 [Apophysomyces sp. BC1015]KAG0171401.1 hypothetical protein DFQ29_008854 [Apophysomyces sp. BC1021]KAG0184842.1 hypothetical protein DFQ28_010355 [Apophysomyces sp. BC1034]